MARWPGGDASSRSAVQALQSVSQPCRGPWPAALYSSAASQPHRLLRTASDAVGRADAFVAEARARVADGANHRSEIRLEDSARLGSPPARRAGATNIRPARATNLSGRPIRLSPRSLR